MGLLYNKSQSGVSKVPGVKEIEALRNPAIDPTVLVQDPRHMDDDLAADDHDEEWDDLSDVEETASISGDEDEDYEIL